MQKCPLCESEEIFINGIVSPFGVNRNFYECQNCGGKSGYYGADWLMDFINESNKIEYIFYPNEHEYKAYERFLSSPEITIKDLKAFLKIVQPNAVLRSKTGLNVRVGDHYPPPGGPQIKKDLELFLNNLPNIHPYKAHCEYESLHPFTDGNGRSGRAIWLWQMYRAGPKERSQVEALGFLHTFYYQALQFSRKDN